jgi:hypothetical protein
MQLYGQQQLLRKPQMTFRFGKATSLLQRTYSNGLLPGQEGSGGFHIRCLDRIRDIS